MEFAADQPHLVDTLRFHLQASRALPQDDIRITVSVEALVPSAEADRAAVEGRIGAALQRFVQGAWTYTRIEREQDTAGYERITLQASTRVPAAENWNLDQRARAASGNGVALASPEVSYALPTERVDAVVGDLRLDLLKSAMAQAAKFSEASGRSWRVGDIEFGTAGFSRARRTSKGAYSDEGSSIELAANPGAVLSGERITLLAAVMLKASAARYQSAGQPMRDEDR